MLLLAFIAGWLAASAVSWLASTLGDFIPSSALPMAIWTLAWLCVAVGVRYFTVGFVYVLGLADDWRFAGLWTFLGTFLLSALDRRALGFGALTLAIGAAASFTGAWVAESRRNHPVVERMREALYWMIPQG